MYNVFLSTIEMTKGDDAEFNVELLYNDKCSRYSMQEGDSLKFIVNNSSGEEQFNISITDGNKLIIPSTKTSSLDTATYKYTVVLTFADGKKQTVANGDFILT